MPSVVKMQNLENGIVQITMEDRNTKNSLSDELIDGLIECFEKIRLDQTYKVAILTGYDSYFCSGGTKEGLMDIHEGNVIYTNKNVFRILLDCDIPVISAMQGHGLGGGFTLGLFADFVVLSKESVYNSGFMKYGFTPGFGTTFILPKKLGLNLAQELMYSADNYRGAELLQRGISFPVLPRNEVLEYAYKLAKKIAEKPRLSLVTLKEHMVAPLREQLAEIVEKELVMHEKTFHHQDEVKKRIYEYFGG